MSNVSIEATPYNNIYKVFGLYCTLYPIKDSIFPIVEEIKLLFNIELIPYTIINNKYIVIEAYVEDGIPKSYPLLKYNDDVKFRHDVRCLLTFCHYIGHSINKNSIIIINNRPSIIIFKISTTKSNSEIFNQYFKYKSSYELMIREMIFGNKHLTYDLEPSLTKNELILILIYRLSSLVNAIINKHNKQYITYGSEFISNIRNDL